MLALAAGRVEAAVDHLDMALGLNESTGVVVSVVLTQLELARALVARDGEGDADRAQVLLQSAAATGDRLGMERVAHKARALLTPDHTAGRDMHGVAQVIRLPRRVARAGGEARAALSTRTRELVGRRTGGVEDEELQRLFGNAAAQRALLTGMAASFQPRMAFGFRGEIQLELRSPPGSPPDWWTLEIRRLTATAQRRVASDPVVTLRVDVPTFIRLFGGELNPIAAWIDGLLDLDGDVLFAPRLIELFGGVRPFDDLTWSVEPPPPPAERSQEALAAS
jgi:hypothetical protein